MSLVLSWASPCSSTSTSPSTATTGTSSRASCSAEQHVDRDVAGSAAYAARATRRAGSAVPSSSGEAGVGDAVGHPRHAAQCWTHRVMLEV